MSERAINLTDEVIPFVPTRHWVLSLPFELRYWMASDDDLLKKVNGIFCAEINNYLCKKARKLGVKGGETGIVSFLQRAGGALNLNLHYHLLVLDGLYTTGEDGSPIITRFPGIENDELACVVRGVSRRVIKYLRKTGRLSEDGEEVYIGDDRDEEHEALSHLKRASVSSRIALGPRAGLKVRRVGSSFGFEEEIPKNQSYGCVSMNGFSIHAATSIKAHERDRLEKLLRYLGRGPVSHERISLDENGNILYKLKSSYDGATHVMFSPMEFIEKLASMIPPPYKHQVNYYGCLSSHSKLRAEIVGSLAVEFCGQDYLQQEFQNDGEAEVEPDDPPASRYIPWAELLKRTFGIDLSTCPKCGGRVRVIAAIIETEAVFKILNHVGLGADPPQIGMKVDKEYVYESFY
ncbi:Putative transposase [Pseudobacteriovorax antillogorgiicola]|uniref:Putative transposase n=2 Tax=Pseudobacteriovorax antillogorgiicola TaxID=1513793 RepID=A0A1Y6BTX0_9BACT|nr:putative transposase [Pseudobacteriovorax antillogorgiicola]SMF27667.1 Putative transposase [Pseudobacteriovorax antillogorgiicola]